MTSTLSKIDRSRVVVGIKGEAIRRLADRGIVTSEGKSGSTSDVAFIRH